jgi:imidazolonepropionase-like amidohydrolase
MKTIPGLEFAPMRRNLLLIVLTLAPLGVAVRAQDMKVITGATLINPAGAPLANAVIVITGSRITQVGTAATFKAPSNAETVDGRGKFVMPGLADMHNHLGDGGLQTKQNVVANLARMLSVGVTTVFDPQLSEAEFTQLKAAAAADTSPNPRFFGTGPSITVEGDALSAGSFKPTTPAEAQAAVRKLKALNVDAIKIVRDDARWASSRLLPLMNIDVLQAIVDEAHKQSLKVYVHSPQLSQAKDALRAGVDGLLHGIIDEPVDQEFLALVKRNSAVYVPTLGLFEDVADISAWAKRQAPYWDQLGLQPPAVYSAYTSGAGAKLFQSIFNNTAYTRDHLPVLRANLKSVADAGVPIVMGTDSGFFGVFLGAATQLELELMVDAGLKPADVLRAATINAARMIGQDKQLGSIEAGKHADLLILDANPLDDIRAVRRIHRVMKGGVVYDPARLPR